MRKFSVDPLPWYLQFIKWRTIEALVRSNNVPWMDTQAFAE